MSSKVVHEEDALREMLEAWSRADVAVHEAALRRFNLEQTIDAQCERLGVEERVEAGVKVVRKPKVMWDQAGLFALRELFSPEEIEQFLTAPRPAPERLFNMTSVKGLLKRGGEVAKLIRASRYEGEARVRLFRTEEKE